MKIPSRQHSTENVPLSKQRSYTEIVELLDRNWSKPESNHVSCLKQLDDALGSIARKLNIIFVSGCNGKSLTMNFAAQLLAHEGLKTGLFYAPHIVNYNERLFINNESISNKDFAQLANEVLNVAQAANIKADTLDILSMTALLHFYTNKVDVVLCEVNEQDPLYTSQVCSPSLVAITRVAVPKDQEDQPNNKVMLEKILATVKKGTHVVSADQSKLHLQDMLDITERNGGVWAMPIRKLAPLKYPFEQLHGRCAALAERIGEIYTNFFMSQEKIKSNSLLAKQKGQRGRPTLEAK